MSGRKIGRNVYRDNTVKCKFPGCTNEFIPYHKTKSRYCGDHTKGEIRALKKIKKLKKPTKLSLIKAAFITREMRYEAARQRAIEMSPNIDKLLWFTPDNGKTIIYCKNEEQLDRAKERFSNIRSRKYTISQE